MQVLDEREKTHGDFAKVAATAQDLKRTFRRSRGQLSSAQAEALDLIATKLARIVCGNPNELDHWKDIAGYAELVARNLRKQELARLADAAAPTITGSVQP